MKFQLENNPAQKQRGILQELRGSGFLPRKRTTMPVPWTQSSTYGQEPIVTSQPHKSASRRPEGDPQTFSLVQTTVRTGSHNFLHRFTLVHVIFSAGSHQFINYLKETLTRVCFQFTPIRINFHAGSHRFTYFFVSVHTVHIIISCRFTLTKSLVTPPPASNPVAYHCLPAPPPVTFHSRKTSESISGRKKTGHSLPPRGSDHSKLGHFPVGNAQS